MKRHIVFEKKEILAVKGGGHMEVFSCKTKIISGSGAIRELEHLGLRRILVVADPYFQNTDLPQRLKMAAKAEETEFFFEVTPDPEVTLAARGAALVRKLQPDGVIALGGGSAMDCAKAMVYFSGLTIPLVAIPTTSGSGSEVTDFAVLTHGGSKHPLVDGAVRPAVAILDGTLLDTLPSGLVADAGYDVLAHAVEGYVATGAGSISDALASAAFAAALRALPRSYRGDCTVRQEIHVAATMAGMAFTQAGLGLCHALAHVLGGRFHVAHGRLNAILLPAVVEVNQCAVPKYAALARSAGMEGTADTVAVRNLRNALIQLRKTLNLPQTLGQVGIPKRQLLQTGLVDAVLADPCCATNPEKVNRGLVQQVLEQVSGNG